MSRRAVFLDRDGVINESTTREGKPYPPRNAQETVLVREARQALQRLRARGFLLLVVTNQPDVRRRTTSREDVEEIHRFLGGELPLDDFFVCYHDEADNCDCRKPLPGLLLQGAEKYGVDVSRSYLIGDRWRDIDAGAAAGCRTIFIDHRYNERSPRVSPDAIVSSLAAAVDWILKEVEFE